MEQKKKETPFTVLVVWLDNIILPYYCITTKQGN